FVTSAGSDSRRLSKIGSSGRRYARRALRLRNQVKTNQPSRKTKPAPMKPTGTAIHTEERRATPLPSPLEDAVKSRGPTTAPPPNVAAGLKESISQRPWIFFTVPMYWIESLFEARDGIISSKSTSVGDAESTVQPWKVVPRAGYG